MSETLQYKVNNSDSLYTNPNYTVYHLTKFDKNAECMLLITNQNFQLEDSDESYDVIERSKSKSSSRKRKLSISSIGNLRIDPLVELLVPINDKNIFISKVPYFKNLLKDDNLFGYKSYKEIDGQKCLIVDDQEPKIYADVLKMFYTGELDLNPNNCIEIYRIADFLNLQVFRDSESDGGSDEVGQTYLADDVHAFITKNFTKLSKVQFDKIREYNFLDKFWDIIHETFNKFAPYEFLHQMAPKEFDQNSDEDSLSIDVMRIEIGHNAFPGVPEKCKISKTKELNKFMQDYSDRRGLVRKDLNFLFQGHPINGNKTPNNLRMMENDEILVTCKVQGSIDDRIHKAYDTIREAMLKIKDLNQCVERHNRDRAARIQALREESQREEANRNREPVAQNPRSSVRRVDNPDLDYISIRVVSMAGNSEEFRISKKHKFAKFMYDYKRRDGGHPLFYFKGRIIGHISTAEELGMKDNDQIEVKY